MTLADAVDRRAEAMLRGRVAFTCWRVGKRRLQKRAFVALAFLKGIV